MSFFDRFKPKKKDADERAADEDLPRMAVGPDSAPRDQAAPDKDFRAREKARIAEAENIGLPSVNRRKGGNKLVTALGFVFILGVGLALIVAVNRDKSPKKADDSKSKKAQIANNLPPISIPPPPVPAPIALAPAQPDTPTSGKSGQGPQVPAIKPGAPGASPIALQPGSGKPGAGMTPTGKPAPIGPDWLERKLSGGLVIESQGNAGARQVSAPPGADTPAAPNSPNPSISSGNALFGAGPKNDLASKLDATPIKGVSASMLPNRNFLLTKAAQIDCALDTAIDSTLPGQTECHTTRDTYSANGHVCLIDKGSKVVGEYQGGIKQGEARVFVLWTRIETPHGVIISLNSPGTDTLGRSGLSGYVDNHFWERFGAAFMMSMLKDSVAAVANRSSASNGTTNVFGNAAGGGEKVVEKILDSTVNIPPTLKKKHGEHIQIMVARDMDFSSVYELQVRQ